MIIVQNEKILNFLLASAALSEMRNSIFVKSRFSRRKARLEKIVLLKLKRI